MKKYKLTTKIKKVSSNKTGNERCERDEILREELNK